MKTGVQQAFLNSFSSLARQLGWFFPRPLPAVDAPETAIAKGAKSNVSSLNSKQSSLGVDRWKYVLGRTAGAVYLSRASRNRSSRGKKLPWYDRAETLAGAELVVMWRPLWS